MSQKSNQIAPEHELKLRWYFGGRGNIFEQSNSDVQFDAVHASNVATFECPVCDGDGMLYCGGIHAKTCSRCGGRGRVERNVKGAMVPRSGYVRCDACRGAVHRNPECEFCHGAGFAVVHAAFCLHESQAITFVAGDAQLFTRQGEMVRCVALLTDDMKTYAERYYGPEGDRWARTHRGRIFSLYDFTAAGKKLLCHSPRAHKRLTALERIGMLAEADKRIPDRSRTELLATAYIQARDILDRFAAAWLLATGGADGQA